MGEKIYGLLGRKLGHSWSVPIHRALGCEDYRLIELEPDRLGDFLRREDIGGLNVTIPYKREVMSFCDVIDEGAEAIGSVNTLVRRSGKLYGYNTDIDGFLYMLRRARISLTGKKVLILGSGGASLTAQAAARRERAREAVVVSRTGPDSYEDLPRRHADAEVLINTTPVGMWPDMDRRPVDLSLLPELGAVADVIYNPGRTSLLLQAEELDREDPGRQADMSRGLPLEAVRRRIRWTGGLSMLVAQAVRAEELFFDRSILADETERIAARLWRDRTNLVLVGMPGCGKTTVGQALAELSGRPFVDLDGEIVRRAGKPIPEIFASQGEGAFRELEAQMLAEVCARNGQVIATGGGAVLRAENRTALRRTGRVYFLRRVLGQLSREGRPLSQSGDLEEMYRARLPLYEAVADRSVRNDTTAEETAAKIWRDLCGYPGDQRP
ncbi:MAG: AAA family ATPase [Lawsonibacter sp.]|nr:AAA family ATPase [Lawsonibacter sp.]MCI9567843.1 AAA family ATPase [Lawsonibacter sp.]